MIKCLAIDDEPLALRQLVSYIEKTPYLEIVGAYPSALQARAVLREQNIDVIFVDINMPDLNGMDFVRSLTNPVMVVFTTAYSEYAIEGFKVDAVDYLLKPFGLEEFQRAANKVRLKYELLHKAMMQEEARPAEISQVDKDEAVYLKTDYKIVRLNLKDIRYIEGMSEYLKIYTMQEAQPLVVLLSMKKMEERLPKNSFMRVHKSYIINLQKIKEVSRARITIAPDAVIPVGDSYRDAFEGYLASKFLGK